MEAGLIAGIVLGTMILALGALAVCDTIREVRRQREARKRREERKCSRQ